MNTVMSWVRGHLEYSNPIFGLLLILNLMVFPVYRASAALAQPVQPMAETAEQISDALDAVEVGATIEQAFGVQPVPIRDWGADQKYFYEALFNVPYDQNDAVYILLTEISETDEFQSVSLETPDGNPFSLQIHLISEYDYTNDDQLSSQDANELAAVNASIFSFIGTAASQFDSLNINGLVIQAARADGGRNRFILIGGYVDGEVVNSLILTHLYVDIAGISPVGEIQNCEDAFNQALSTYSGSLSDARSNLKSCQDTAAASAIHSLADCLRLAGGSGVAAGIAASSGPVGAIAALIVFSVCGIAAAADMATDLWQCSNAYKAAVAAAQNAFAAAKAAARATFGVENCPGDPV